MTTLQVVIAILGSLAAIVFVFLAFTKTIGQAANSLEQIRDVFVVVSFVTVSFGYTNFLIALFFRRFLKRYINKGDMRHGYCYSI
jgi:hypothetical protein